MSANWRIEPGAGQLKLALTCALERRDAVSIWHGGLPVAIVLDKANVERLLLGESEEVRKLRTWVADLQSGMYVNCVYCGHRYGPGEMTPVSMADALKAHVAACPSHPMAGLVGAVTAACDLLAERTQGSPARSPGHNARLLLEEALLAATGKPTPGHA